MWKCQFHSSAPCSEGGIHHFAQDPARLKKASVCLRSSSLCFFFPWSRPVKPAILMPKSHLNSSCFIIFGMEYDSDSKYELQFQIVAFHSLLSQQSDDFQVTFFLIIFWVEFQSYCAEAVGYGSPCHHFLVPRESTRLHSCSLGFLLKMHIPWSS